MENESQIYEDSDIQDFRAKSKESNDDAPAVKGQLVAYAVCTVIGLAVGIVIGLKIG